MTAPAQPASPSVAAPAVVPHKPKPKPLPSRLLPPPVTVRAEAPTAAPAAPPRPAAPPPMRAVLPPSVVSSGQAVRPSPLVSIGTMAAAPAVAAPPSARPVSPARAEPRLSPSLTTQGVLSGKSVRDHSFAGSAGNVVRVTLSGANPLAYFVLRGPDNGIVTSAETRDWMGSLPAAGRYTVQVFLYRDGVGAGGAVDYRLRVNTVKP